MNFRICCLTFIALTLLACDPPKKVKTADVPIVERSDYISLFDGSSLNGWRTYNTDTLSAGWSIVNGELTLMAGSKGDIIYAAEEFDNFELSLEWKIAKGGNSGILYHIQEGSAYKAPYETAPEYQLLDDLEFAYPVEEWQKLGADYAMYTADPDKKKVKAAGEWNTSRIVFTPQKVEHWLNGEKLLEFVPWSQDWENRKSNGKWKDYPDYGVAKSGYIGLQEHEDGVAFRNIKIKKL